MLTPQKGTYSAIREFRTTWPADLLYSLAALKGMLLGLAAFFPTVGHAAA